MAAQLVGEDEISARSWERAHLQLLERGDPRAALDALRTACAEWAKLEAPYEHARSRVLAGRLPNQTAIAEEVVAGTTRWGVVHLAAGFASALIAVAFLSVRRHLHEAGEDRLSGLGIPLVIVGSTLYAVMPGMEFAVLAAADTGTTTAEVAEVQDAIGPWFMAVSIGSGLTFGLGAISFVGATTASKIAIARITQGVSVALIVMALSRIVPLSVAQF